MWPVVAIVVAGVIGLLYYLNPRYSNTHKPQSQDNKQNKAGCAVPEEIMSNFNGIDIVDDHDTLYKLSEESHCCELQGSMCNSNTLNLSESSTDKPKERRVEKPNEEDIMYAFSSNSDAFDAFEWRKPIPGNVLKALADPNNHLIGVYGSLYHTKETLVERVKRRIQRDNLFDRVLTATITEKPDVKKIQEDIAHQLGFTFNHVSKDKRANELIQRIKNEQNLLIVLCHLDKGLDLLKVGIPYGADHPGCKILITSTNEDVLSKHMHTQINFMV